MQLELRERWREKDFAKVRKIGLRKQRYRFSNMITWLSKTDFPVVIYLSPDT